jgi:hypothetical protein
MAKINELSNEVSNFADICKSLKSILKRRMNGEDFDCRAMGSFCITDLKNSNMKAQILKDDITKQVNLLNRLILYIS